MALFWDINGNWIFSVATSHKWEENDVWSQIFGNLGFPTSAFLKTLKNCKSSYKWKKVSYIKDQVGNPGGPEIWV